MNNDSLSYISILKESNINASHIAELRKEVGWLPFSQKLETVLHNSHSCYTVRDNGILVGFARVNSDRGIHAHIVDVMIHPHYQRKGLGRKLVKKVVADLKKEGFTYISATFSECLIPFYKAIGFDIRGGGLITNLQ